MKNTYFTFFLLFIGLISYAQVSEGQITYSIEIESDDPMVSSMADGSTMDIYFTPNNTRVDVEMAMMTTVVIYNEKTNKGLMLMDMFGMKVAVPMSSEDLNKAEKESKTEKNDTKTVLTNEKKKILGYTCKKAVVTDADNTESIYWYTEEIKMNKKGQQNINNEIPGASLMLVIEKNGMITTMTATKFSKEKVDKSKFDLTIPEGYEEKTMDEMQKTGM